MDERREPIRHMPQREAGHSEILQKGGRLNSPRVLSSAHDFVACPEPSFRSLCLTTRDLCLSRTITHRDYSGAASMPFRRLSAAYLALVLSSVVFGAITLITSFFRNSLNAN